jgi:hypothetical protein
MSARGLFVNPNLTLSKKGENMPASPKNRHDLEAVLNAKAWKDPKFKKKLLEDPKSALKEMGIDVPAKTKVRIVEDDKNTVTFVLLPAPESVGQVEEEELRRVAGGQCLQSQCAPHAHSAIPHWTIDCEEKVYH